MARLGEVNYLKKRQKNKKGKQQEENKMKEYIVEIEGVSDMIHNRLSKDLIDEMSQVPNAKKVEWDEENYEKKLYKNKDGNIIVPELVIYSFLQEACKKYKVNPPKSIGRTWTNYFKSCVMILEDAVLDNVEVNPFGCMVNGSPSSSKGSSKVYRIRPRITKGWVTKLKFIDTGDYLDKNTVEGILSAGGMFVGLCDWRPLHGRFKVINVKTVEKNV